MYISIIINVHSAFKSFRSLHMKCKQGSSDQKLLKIHTFALFFLVLYLKDGLDKTPYIQFFFNCLDLIFLTKY